MNGIEISVKRDHQIKCKDLRADDTGLFLNNLLGNLHYENLYKENGSLRI